MSGQVLTIVSVVEIVVLVGVLALYLIAIARLLRSIASQLATLAAGLEVVEGHVSIVTPGSAAANAVLSDVVKLPGHVVRKADRIAARAGA